MEQTDEHFFDGMTERSVIAVVGPTASGKSSLSVRIASEIGGEIVSCDSMQVYRGMNIGTAKITPAEMMGIPHYLIDVADPDSSFSCADYTVLARAAIDDIISRGKTPILCGGTGLYMESAIYDRTMESPGGDAEIRAELDARSNEENYTELLEVDPESASAIHKNNRKRVIRALEIYRVSGISKSEWDRKSKINSSGYDARIVVLDASDREALYKRADSRVDKMMADGLLDEVESLSLNPESTAGQAIGYKELAIYLDGGCTLDEAVENIKRASRNYIKRQITWFKRYKSAYRIDICDPDSADNFVKLLLKNLPSNK